MIISVVTTFMAIFLVVGPTVTGYTITTKLVEKSRREQRRIERIEQVSNVNPHEACE